jgi:hypothetical protein
MPIYSDLAQAALHGGHHARLVMPSRLASQATHCSSPPRRTRQSSPPGTYTNATFILMSRRGYMFRSVHVAVTVQRATAQARHTRCRYGCTTRFLGRTPGTIGSGKSATHRRIGGLTVAVWRKLTPRTTASSGSSCSMELWALPIRRQPPPGHGRPSSLPSSLRPSTGSPLGWPRIGP